MFNKIKLYKKVMFQNNIQGISRNWKEKFKLYRSGYYKMFKMENGCQNMHPKEICNIWFKAEYTHRGAKNVNLDMSTKSL